VLVLVAAEERRAAVIVSCRHKDIDRWTEQQLNYQSSAADDDDVPGELSQ